MADFRKWILALTVLTLVFTGVANAQGGVTGESNLTCVAGTAVPPQLRTEGYTELVGDITLNCTGGALPAAGAGALIPQANIVVNLQGTITSRLLGNGSEALLLIDEPGATGLGGIGPALPQNRCTTPLTGCLAYVGTVTDAGGTGTYAVYPQYSNTAASNVFQGVTNGSQVTFYGVPILAPVSTGLSRIFRITNIRVNANGITGGGSGFQSVLAQISVNNVPVSVTNPTVTVGYIQQSFAGTFRDGTNSKTISTDNEFQCEPQTDKAVAVLRFSELFGTAFKDRFSGNGAAYPGTVTTPVTQNTPGAIYNAESGFVSTFNGNPLTATPVSGGATYTAGMADYGTRLKAVFSNIPSGVSVYVSTVNLNDGGALTSGSPEPTGTQPAVGGSPELAYMVTSEAGIDNPIPLQTATASMTPIGTGITGQNAVPQWLLPVSSTGTSLAIWEVVQELPNTIENFDFGVYITFPNNILPTQGISATLSYAPTPTAPFSASAAGVASSTLTIPRFAISAASSGTPFLNINLCNTALLFPYITTAFLVAGQSGFDTGISIANTTSDPFGTVNQAGTCQLYWYGGPPGATTAATNPTPTTLGAGGVGSSIPILTGTTALTLASQNVPANWSGYMIALCNFQFAHGYASVTDVGVRNIMASYLALVINTEGSALRSTNGALFLAPEALNN